MRDRTCPLLVITLFPIGHEPYNEERTRTLFRGGVSTLATREFLLTPPMNRLVVGRDKSTLLDSLPHNFLLVHDETDIPLPKRRKVTHFDVSQHSFNPLKNISYLRAREFVEVINAAFPEGQNTLTRRAATTALLEWLLSKPQNLERFPRASRDDVGLKDAGDKIQTLLLSPVLHRVLCNPTNVSFQGIVLARINRAELGDFDAFILGNLLISAYKGQVVIPDFGFYGRAHHTTLIRQNRLIAGVNFLDESPLKKQLLLIEDKIPSRCLPEDAETLASFVGLRPHTNEYNDFVEECVRWRNLGASSHYSGCR